MHTKNQTISLAGFQSPCCRYLVIVPPVLSLLFLGGQSHKRMCVCLLPAFNIIRYTEALIPAIQVGIDICLAKLFVLQFVSVSWRDLLTLIVIAGN